MVATPDRGNAIPEPSLLVVERHNKTSLRARAANTALEWALTPYLRNLAGAKVLTPEIAAGLAKIDQAARHAPVPRGTWAEATTVPMAGAGLPAEWVHGPRTPPLRTRVILYLHGGGWLFGGLNSHRAITSRISSAAAVPVLNLGYRMVPSVEFDQEVDDCVAGYRWLLSIGIAPRNIVIMGDSAGGYLTVATALRLRDRGLPQPAGLVGLSGVYDMSLASKAAHANAKRDPAGALAGLEWTMEVLLGGRDPADPTISPMRADLTGLPPTLLVASASEIIYCDSEDLALRLASSGVACTLQVWAGQPHVFQLFHPLIPEARRSIADIGRFVNETLHRP